METLAWPHHFIRGKIWAHKTSLNLMCFINVPVSSQQREPSCRCVLGISILPLFQCTEKEHKYKGCTLFFFVRVSDISVITVYLYSFHTTIPLFNPKRQKRQISYWDKTKTTLTLIKSPLTSPKIYLLCLGDVFNQINTTGVTSGAGTTNPSGAPEFTPVFSGVRVTRSLVLYGCFVDRCLSFCTFSFGHCVVCSSSIYGFSLPLWYL